MSELEMITKAVEKLDPDFARRMRIEPTKVQRYPTDFFKNGRIYHIAVNGPYGPRLMTLGFIEKEYAVSLSDHAEGFFDLAKRAGVLLDTPQRRNAYVRTFLDVTKDFTKRTQFIDEFPALRKTDQTTPQELERYDALKKKYGPIIKRVSLSDEQPWEGKAYAIVVWDLYEYAVTLQPDGKIEVKPTELEKMLPRCIDLGQGPPSEPAKPASAPAPAPIGAK